MIGQIQLLTDDPEKVKKTIEGMKKELIEIANTKDPKLISFGGGARDIEVRILKKGKGGMAVIVGLANKELASNPMEFIDGEKMLTGCFMGSTNLAVDIPKLVALYQAGILKLDELISKRYSLDQINEAIAAVKTGAVMRNVITF